MLAGAIQTKEHARKKNLIRFCANLWFLQFSISFNFDQQPRIDQATDFHHRGGRHDLAKDFSVRASVFFPARNVSHVHARAHDMFESGSESLQRAFNISQALFRLFVSVTNSNDLAVFAYCRRARDVNAVADSDSARIADDRLPLGARRDFLSFLHNPPTALPYRPTPRRLPAWGPRGRAATSVTNRQRFARSCRAAGRGRTARCSALRESNPDSDQQPPTRPRRVAPAR